MQRTRLVKGKLTGPTTIELDEAVVGMTSEVDVLIRPAPTVPLLSISEYLKTLPPGTRSKEDIDQQIRDERDSWGDR